MKSTTAANVDFFENLTSLPLDIIARIIAYLPRCILPEILSFARIRDIVASEILSAIDITDWTRNCYKNNAARTRASHCICNVFTIKPKNFKLAMDQWHMYPKLLKIGDFSTFQYILETDPEILHKAIHLHGRFHPENIDDPNPSFELLINSGTRFDSLFLSSFGNVHSLPAITKNLQLSSTILEDYNIGGLKKLSLDMTLHSETEVPYNLYSNMEELHLLLCYPTNMILPKKLRKLIVDTSHENRVAFAPQALFNLEYIKYFQSCMKSLNETRLVTPNLKLLYLSCCHKFSDFGSLKRLKHLQDLKIYDCIYPIDLFNGKAFSELRRFEYTASSIDGKLPNFEVPETFKNLTLTFPANLKVLSINNAMFMKINLNTLKLPTSLTNLKLSNTPLSEGYLYFPENLRFIEIDVPKVSFKSDFQLPRAAVEVTIEADIIIFEGTDFIYNLPEKLSHLTLKAGFKGAIVPLTQKVKWPSLMKYFYLKNFYTDEEQLRLLNLKESNLQTIEIFRGRVKKLPDDLFPVSVKSLSLIRMGIEELPQSFECLQNLHQLYLRFNNLKNVKPVKLPLSNLKYLDLSCSKLRLLSPFLQSNLEEARFDDEITVVTECNWNLNVIDARQMLKKIKGLSLYVDGFHKTLKNISLHSSRLHILDVHDDPFFDEQEYNASLEVVSSCSSEDLYCGSDSDLDEEENERAKKRRKKGNPQ